MTQSFPALLSDAFEPIRLLGTGSFGRVFLARDLGLDREVALKVLRAPEDPELRSRFVLEAQALAGLEHENVVRIYDYGLAGEQPYLVMEYLEGRTLRDIEVPESPRHVLHDVAQGLGAIHAARLVHRDLKPDNVMVTPQGRSVIVDFGLVRQRGVATRITRDGSMVGTPAYMAPECLRGEAATEASDWYSWAVLAFRYLERRSPQEPEAILAHIAGAALPVPTFRILDPAGREAQLLLHLLRPDRTKRRDCLARIEADLSTGDSTGPRPPPPPEATVPLPEARFSLDASPPALPRRPGWRAFATLLLALLVIGVWTGEPPPPPPPADTPPVEPSLTEVRRQAYLERLEALIRPHREPSGELHLGLAGDEYDAHRSLVVREYLDPRTPLRWKRVFETLAAWVESQENAERGREVLDVEIRERLLTALAHLSVDRGLAVAVAWESALPGAAFEGGPLDSEALSGLRDRIRDVDEAVGEGILGLPSPKAGEPGWAQVLRLLLWGAFDPPSLPGPEEGLEATRRALARGDLSPRKRHILWDAGLGFIPGAFDHAHIPCDAQVNFLRAALDYHEGLAVRGGLPASLFFEAHLLFQIISLGSKCPGVDPARRERIGSLIDWLEARLDVDPSLAEVYFRWCGSIGTSMMLVGGVQRFNKESLRVQKLLEKVQALEP